MSPLRNIPGLNNPVVIKTDMLHTFNLGIGGDLASSGVVALAKMKLFQGRALQAQLDYAYDLFDEWCKINNRPLLPKHSKRASSTCQRLMKQIGTFWCLL